MLIVIDDEKIIDLLKWRTILRGCLTDTSKIWRKKNDNS